MKNKYLNICFKIVAVIVLHMFVLNTIPSWSLPHDMNLAAQTPFNSFSSVIKHKHLIESHIFGLMRDLKWEGISVLKGEITKYIVNENERISVSLDVSSRKEEEFRELLGGMPDSYILRCRAGGVQYYALVVFSDKEEGLKPGAVNVKIFTEEEFAEFKKEKEKVKRLAENLPAERADEPGILGRIGDYVRTSEVEFNLTDAKTYEGEIQFKGYHIADSKRKISDVRIRVDKAHYLAFMGYNTSAVELPEGGKDEKGIFRRFGLFAVIFEKLANDHKKAKKLKELEESHIKVLADTTTSVFETLRHVVDEVYGQYGLTEVDLRRTYMRAFYYWKNIRILKKEKKLEGSERSAKEVISWLKDEIRVCDIFGQPIGSRANYAFVRDLTQGHRLEEILRFAEKNAKTEHKINRANFLYEHVGGILSNETELLLVRMAQLEARRNVPEEKRIASRLLNKKLAKSVDKYTNRVYKLKTTGRQWVRTGKLWSGTKCGEEEGAVGALEYFGAKEEDIRKMSIAEPEKIEGTDEIFAGEWLSYFCNDAMSTREDLPGVREYVQAYHLSLLFGEDIAGKWLYERFDGYMPFTVKYLFSGPGFSTQIHLLEGLFGKPETFIMVAVHKELGEVVLSFKQEFIDKNLEEKTRIIKEALKAVKEQSNIRPILNLMNILKAKRGEIKEKDVTDVKGYALHTAGIVDVADLTDDDWRMKVINKGMMGFLEVATNQFVVDPDAVDPATLRLLDHCVEKVKKLLNVDVSARHVDEEKVLASLEKLTGATPATALTKPDKVTTYYDESGKEVVSEKRFFKIGDPYDLSILDFMEKDAVIPVEQDEFGMAHTVLMAQGKPRGKRERTEITLIPEKGPTETIVLKRAEGIRISVSFKGRMEVKALDKGAWSVWVTVPYSDSPPVSNENDIFVRKGMQFDITPSMHDSIFSLLPVMTELKHPEKSHPKKGGSPADYLLSLAEKEYEDLREGHTVNEYMERVTPGVSKAKINKVIQTNISRGNVEKGDYVPGKGYQYRLTRKGQGRAEYINHVKNNAEKSAAGLVNALVNLSRNTEEGEKILFALDNELGREGTRALVSQIAGRIIELRDNEEIKSLLNKIIMIDAPGEDLAQQVLEYTTDEGKDGVKIKKNNVIMITKDTNAENCMDFVDEAVITFVNDKAINPMDYYPLPEIVFFTLAKSLYHRQIDGFTKENKLVDLFKSFKSETLDDKEIIEFCIKNKVSKIVLRPAEPFEYDELKSIYGGVQRFLQSV